MVWPISLHITAKVTCIHNTDPSLSPRPSQGSDWKIYLYSVVVGSPGAVGMQFSSTRRFSFRRFLFSQWVPTSYSHVKARVTQACDILLVVSQPVVTFSFVTKLQTTSRTENHRDCRPPGPVPRLVICCTRLITVWVTRTRTDPALPSSLPSSPGLAMSGTSASDTDSRPLSQFELPGLRSQSPAGTAFEDIFIYFNFFCTMT